MSIQFEAPLIMFTSQFEEKLLNEEDIETAKTLVRNKIPEIYTPEQIPDTYDIDVNAAGVVTITYEPNGD